MSSELTSDAIKDRIAAFGNWYHQITLAPGITTPGINATALVLDRLGLPEDCRGLRALDIGARDGFFSFELERRGAEVLAIDYMEPSETGFVIARDILKSKVTYKVANVYDLNPKEYGRFDIVLFLGILYHLRNPMLALDRIWAVCRNKLWVESHVIDNSFLRAGGAVPLAQISAELVQAPIMQFYPGASLNSDPTNWWAPNMACLRAMLEQANFTVQRELLHGNRGIIECAVNDDPDISYYRAVERSAGFADK